jgi:adenylate cyclase
MAGSSTALPALDRVLAAGRLTHTGSEIAALAGVDTAWAARVWRAAGFDGAFDERELSEDDARMLAGAAELVRSGRFDEAELLQLARLFNLAVAPLAESAAHSIRRGRPPGDDGDALLEDLESSIALFEDVVLHTWRRRLLRVLASGRTTERCDEAVGFADLAGFTALVRRDDDGWLCALDRLEAVAFDVVARHGGRVIKTIGDEVMWVHPEPGGMVAIVVDLAAAAAADEALPPLRIGAAWGATVATRGDRFGMAVNLASRLVRRCRAGEVLLCPTLTVHAPGARRGLPRLIKGIGWIRPGRIAHSAARPGVDRQ